MNSLFNLYWIIQICPTREETNTENKNLEGHKIKGDLELPNIGIML